MAFMFSMEKNKQQRWTTVTTSNILKIQKKGHKLVVEKIRFQCLAVALFYNLITF